MRSWLRTHTSAVVLAMLLVSAAGCGAVARAAFTQPTVQFRGVGVRAVRLDGGDFEVRLHLANPNSFTIDATRLRYRLLVDSVEIGAGALDSGFAVAANDSAIVRLPVRIGFAAVRSVGARLLQGGEIPYRVIGDVSLKTFVGSFTKAFDEAGRYDAFKALGR
jgi:LEA14-like dessication related protein